MTEFAYHRPAGSKGPKPYSGGAGRQARTTVGNTNYTIKAWDRIVALIAPLTANRSWTLPRAASVPPGYAITIEDQEGGIGSGLILPNPTPSDTINNTILPSLLPVMARTHGRMTFVSDGVSNWSYDPLQEGYVSGSLTVAQGALINGGLEVLNGDLEILDDANVMGALEVGGVATFNGNILNANLRDSTTSFYDNVDDTKQLRFQLSGITTGTTRTLAAPDESGTIVTTANVQQSGATSPLGYTTGAGGTVTQLTSKTTAVTLNKPCGTVTTHNASLAAATSISFTVNHSVVSAGDVVILNSRNASYRAEVEDVTAGSFIVRLTNLTAGLLSQAVIINFAVLNVATS